MEFNQLEWMKNSFRSSDCNFQSDTENKEGENPVGNILPVRTQFFDDLLGMAVEKEDQGTHQQDGQNDGGCIDEVIFPVFVCTVGT